MNHPGVLILILLVAVGFGANCFHSYQCRNYESITGKETRWVTMDTCYVHTAQGWQRWDEYKVRAVASEGLKEVRDE